MDTSLLWNNSCGCDPSWQPASLSSQRISLHLHFRTAASRASPVTTLLLGSIPTCLDSAFLEPDDGWHAVTCARRHVHSVCWVEDTVDNWLNIIIFSECGRAVTPLPQAEDTSHHNLIEYFVTMFWSWCVTHWLMGGSHIAQVTGRHGHLAIRVTLSRNSLMFQ